jgi:hypothetical protein
MNSSKHGPEPGYPVSVLMVSFRNFRATCWSVMPWKGLNCYLHPLQCIIHKSSYHQRYSTNVVGNISINKRIINKLIHEFKSFLRRGQSIRWSKNIRNLFNRKISYSVHKVLPRGPDLSQFNPVHFLSVSSQDKSRIWFLRYGSETASCQQCTSSTENHLTEVLSLVMACVPRRQYKQRNSNKPTDGISLTPGNITRSW